MKKRGAGIALMLYGLGFGFNRPDIAGAAIELAPDGSVTLFTGACELGQGSLTVLTQIAAEELGVRPEAVRVVNADTAATPDSGPTTATRQTYVSGNAVRKAASEIKKNLFEAAAAKLEADPDDLVARDGRIYVSGAPDRGISVADAAAICHGTGKKFVALGWHDITTKDVNPETSQGDAYASYIYAAQLAEVEVDTETGKVEVLRFAAAHDVGRAINPQSVETQIEGGISMGIGYALMEEQIIELGIPKVNSLETYLLPTSLDCPEVKAFIVEEEEPTGPFGAKGVAEAAAIPSAPAILNAIYNAVGVRITDIPATAEKVLNAIRELKKSLNADKNPSNVQEENTS